MDENDTDVEAFLRRFEPDQPKPLPQPRTLPIPLAAIAVFVIGAGLAAQFYWRKPNLDLPHAVQKPNANSSVQAPDGPARPLRAPAANECRVQVREGIRPPRKIVDVRPVYPEDARAKGIQGTVILDVIIGDDGSIIDTAVVRSVPELEQAAIDAVSQWVFETTLLNGKPCEVEMNVLVQFTLPV